MIREYYGSRYAKDIFYDNSISGLNDTNLQDVLDQLAQKSSIVDGEVDTFNDLPDVVIHSQEIWVVKNTTGVIGINRKVQGWYYSDGITWTKLNNEYSADKTYFNNNGTDLISNNTQNAIVELEDKKANISKVGTVADFEATLSQT